MTARKCNWLIAVLTSGVFLLDVVVAPGWSVSRFYLVCILLTYRSYCNKSPFVFAAISTVLTICGNAVSSSGPASQTISTTFWPDIPLFWIVATFVVAMNHSIRNDTQLETADEQKRIETALRESEQRFAGFMQHLPGHAWIKDSEGRYVFVNETFERTLRLSHGASHGLTDEDLFSPHTASEFRKNDQLVMSGSTEVNVIQSVQHPDGTSHTYLVNKFPIPGREGQTTLYGGMAIDITAQYRAEAELGLERDRFDAIASTVPGGIYSLRRRTDGTFCLPYISPVIRTVYGIQSANLANAASILMQHIVPEDRELLLATLNKSAESMTRWREIFRAQHPQKGIISIETHAHPIRDADGSTLWHGFIMDVTERKRAEETLNRNQERLRLIIETVAEGIMVQLADGTITECNSEAERILGLSSEQLIGRYPNDPRWHLIWENGDQIPGEDMPTAVTLRTGKPSRDVVMGVHKPDGQIAWISVNTAPSFDAQGQVSMVITSFGDITINKQMQDAWKKSETRFSQVFKSIPTMMAISTYPAGIIVDWNPFALKMMGFNLEETLGHRAVDLGQWPYPQQRADLIAAVERGEPVRNVECVIRAKTGQLYTVLTSVEPIEFAGENCLLFIHHNITARKQAEELLRESELRYRSLVDSAPAGIYVDRENKFAYVNEAMCRMMGAASKEELLGTPVFDRLPKEILPTILDRIDRVLIHGETAPLMEHRYLRLDGSPIDVETIAIPIQFDQQPAIQVVVNDITERVRTQARLHATETRLATIFHSCPVGMCITSVEDGTVLEVNEVCCEIGGYRPEEVIGRSSIDLGYWFQLEEREELLRILRRDGSLKNVEVAFRRKDGSLGYTLRSFERLILDGQECILTMLNDITDRKQIDEELRASRQRLEVLSRQLITTQETERRHLARELHDEVGQMLTAIKMNLRRAQRASDTSVQSFLEDNVQMVDQAISQVRNLSLRLRPPQLDELGLVAALHWLVKLQAQNGRFVEQLDVELGEVTISTDLATVCFRIVQEALTNAVRHGQPNNVQIKLRATNDELYLLVQDDGIGFNVHEARKRAASGASLGLLSMQERVSLVNGRLTIDSAPGQGTKIQTWFPLTSS